MTDRTNSQRAALDRSAATHRQVLAAPHRFKVVTGDRPTGPLHLGHYFGTLKNRVWLQDLGVDVTVLIADYQVLTDRPASARLAATVRGLVADYLAVGIDPHRSTIFTHSAVPALNELVVPFLSLVSEAELHRNPTVRAETVASGKPPSGLMLCYPVHQAADILFGRANLVPVGLDQLPHIEMTRLIARRFNDRYAGSEPFFPEPEPLLTEIPLLTGLDGAKMSKTRGNAISLCDSEDHTAAVIRRAPTDGEQHITYDPISRPSIANLLDLLAAVTGRNPRALADEIGSGSGQLKRKVTEAINDLLRPVRQRRAELAAEPSYLDDVLASGNAKTRELADGTLAAVHDLLGMTYHRTLPSQ